MNEIKPETLYHDLAMSGLSLREFCKKHGLPRRSVERTLQHLPPHDEETLWLYREVVDTVENHPEDPNFDYLHYQIPEPMSKLRKLENIYLKH